MRWFTGLAAGVALGFALAAPALGADVLWQGAASTECQIALSFADGPVEIVLGAAVPRLLGDPRQVAVAVAEQAGATALAVTPHGTRTSGSAGVVLEAPTTCRLNVETTTGNVTLFAPENADLGVQLATSGEITVDFSVAISYHRHEEPAKRGSITIGSGAIEARLSSRQGAIRVLRPRR